VGVSKVWESFSKTSSPPPYPHPSGFTLPLPGVWKSKQVCVSERETPAGWNQSESIPYFVEGTLIQPSASHDEASTDVVPQTKQNEKKRVSVLY